MDDGGRTLLGDLLQQSPVGGGDLHDLAVGGVLELLVPALELAGDVALLAAQLAEADGVGVDGVDLGQGGGQRHAGGPPDLHGDLVGDPGVADDQAVDEVHDVERRPVHGLVGAEPHHRRHRHVGVGEGRDDRVLAAHVVRRGEHVTHGRAAQHPSAVGGVGDAEREVRAAASDQLEREGRRRVGVLGEPGGDRRNVDAGDGRVVAHSGRT